MHLEIWESLGRVILIAYSPDHLTVFNPKQRKAWFPLTLARQFGLFWGAWYWVVVICHFGFFKGNNEAEAAAQRCKFLGPISLSCNDFIYYLPDITQRVLGTES